MQKQELNLRNGSVAHLAILCGAPFEKRWSKQITTNLKRFSLQKTIFPEKKIQILRVFNDARFASSFSFQDHRLGGI